MGGSGELGNGAEREIFEWVETGHITPKHLLQRINNKYVLSQI